MLAGKRIPRWLTTSLAATRIALSAGTGQHVQVSTYRLTALDCHVKGCGVITLLVKFTPIEEPGGMTAQTLIERSAGSSTGLSAIHT
jgi:hypothetical protein